MSMSNEQIERHIESLIAWQARFEENQAKLDRKLVTLTDATLSLVNVVQRHDNQIAGLIESDKQLRAHIQELRNVGKETDAKIRELRDAGKDTDARLNAVILLFERSLGRDKSK
jgi:peptidoglycan hydrolase CwlO-like protein